MSFLPFSVATQAKINLGLRVLGRRPDGYHSIESIFVAINLYDVLRIEPSPSFSVSCVPEVTLRPEHNIVYRACQLYAERFPDDIGGAKITVEKRIPTGAGLGGGSGDAAAALLAMADINGRAHTPELIGILEPLAAACGSDVPFFLRSGVALVTGRGEHVKPLTLNVPWTILVVCPGIHINTAMAYSTLGITREQPSPGLEAEIVQAIERKDINPQVFENDFERAVFPQHPILREIRQRIINTGAVFASMSGSGSSIYGLFSTREDAVSAAAALENLAPYLCEPCTAPYRRL